MLLPIAADVLIHNSRLLRVHLPRIQVKKHQSVPRRNSFSQECGAVTSAEAETDVTNLGVKCAIKQAQGERSTLPLSSMMLLQDHLGSPLKSSVSIVSMQYARTDWGGGVGNRSARVRRHW